MHAHHIDEKHLYPEQAYDLENGICVCQDCHYQVVHAAHGHPKVFRHMFKRHNDRKYNRVFNNKNQRRLK